MAKNDLVSDCNMKKNNLVGAAVVPRINLEFKGLKKQEMQEIKLRIGLLVNESSFISDLMVILSDLMARSDLIVILSDLIATVSDLIVSLSDFIATLLV